MTKTLSRRTFVRTAGIGAAGLLAAPATAAVLKRKPAAFSAGLVLPVDGSYSRMSDSFTDGFRMALDAAKAQAALTTRLLPQGLGAYEAIQELVAGGVDLIVAGVTSPVAHLVAPLVADRQIPLIVANVGAHLEPAAPDNPFVLRNSLQYWQASYALGGWTAAQVGRSGFIASSLADSGYDNVLAFRVGLEGGGGGIVGTQVTHVDPADNGLAALLDAIRSTGANVVYANYSGQMAVDFLRAYASSGLRVPVVGPAFLAEDYAAAAVGNGALGVRTSSSWTYADRSKANRSFVTAYAQRTGRPADPFAVLGYDTGNLVLTGLANARHAGLPNSRLVDALAGASITSPRGTLTVDASTRTVVGPLSIREMRGRASRLANEVVSTLPAVASLPSGLEPALAQPSGYLNEVLFA
jgi:branched-chain amino acid transport system substrate-binding protein